MKNITREERALLPFVNIMGVEHYDITEPRRHMWKKSQKKIRREKRQKGGSR